MTGTPGASADGRHDGPRVVSLVPSVTETLLAWGVVPVGVTRFCEQPTLQAVGGTKDPDLDAVASMRPDVVVVCEEENRLEDAQAMTDLGLDLHVVRIDTVDDVAPALDALAHRLGLAPPADLGAPSSAVPGGDPPVDPPAASPTATAWVPVWRRPWVALGPGCYGSSLLGSLGVETLPAASDDRYPRLDLDEVAALAPDLVVAPSEPYPFAERHRAELEAVAPVAFVDGQDLFWWGVRTPDARRRLAQVLAPALRGR